MVCCGALTLPLQAAASGCGSSGAALPAAVAAAGYCLNTFSTNTFTSGTSGNVDFNYAYGGSYPQWFPYHDLALNPGYADMGQVKVVNGTLVLHGDTTGPGGEITSATPRPDQAVPYAGTAFGGGAYIEAVLKMDISNFSYETGTPAFWSMALERYSLWWADYGLSDQWLGQVDGVSGTGFGYEHFVEPDFMEYHGENNDSSYDGFFHDWYGTQQVTCPGELYCDGWYNIPASAQYAQEVRTPANKPNFARYHRYGFLWVPATATSPGFARYFFDGQPVGEDYAWDQWTDPQAPAVIYHSRKSPMFGIIDKQHLVLILGTGMGKNNLGDTMTVKSVNVWQTSAVDNLTAQAPPCTYALGRDSASFSSSGAQEASFSVNTGCVWAAKVGNALNSFSWITLANTVSSSIGNGTVSYSVAPNTSQLPRTGFIRVADQTFTIVQAGAVVQTNKHLDASGTIGASAIDQGHHVLGVARA
jgi:hypothetical protein